MTEGNPLTSQPYGGRDDKPDEAGLPGERPAGEGEEQVSAPGSEQRQGEMGSRAAEDGPMTSQDVDEFGPSPGIPDRVEPPSPGDATDADSPGGSVANQQGRAPDQ